MHHTLHCLLRRLCSVAMRVSVLELETVDVGDTATRLKLARAGSGRRRLEPLTTGHTVVETPPLAQRRTTLPAAQISFGKGVSERGRFRASGDNWTQLEPRDTHACPDPLPSRARTHRPASPLTRCCHHSSLAVHTLACSSAYIEYITAGTLRTSPHIIVRFVGCRVCSPVLRVRRVVSSEMGGGRQIARRLRR